LDILTLSVKRPKLNLSRRPRFTFILLCLLAVPGVSSVRAQERVTDLLPATQTNKSTSTEPALDRANQLFRDGKFPAAAEAFKGITSSDPESALAYVGLARVYLALKQPDEAAAAASKAAKLKPDLDAAHVALGEVYFRQGKMADAENEFTPLVKANTKEARAYLGLSLLYHAASYYRHAKLQIDRAHDLDAADPDIQRSWMRTLSRAEQLRALAAYLGEFPNEEAERHASQIERLNILQESIHPCRLATKANRAEIKMEPLRYDPSHLRAYALGVKINGASSQLVLDTGASGLVINRKLAEKAGVKPITDATVKGVGDKVAPGAFVGHADAITIGNLEFQDCYVKVIDRGSVAEEDGLIGADIFSDFLVELNFPDSKIRLSELPPRPPDTDPESKLKGFEDRYVAPEMKEYTKVFRFGHLLLVQTHLNDLPANLFLLDTGAFSNIISPAAARQVTKISSDGDTTVKGLNGAVKNVFRADDLMLSFGHLRQRNLDIVAFDTKSISDSIGVEVSGTLGFAMLRLLDIKIDYRDGLIDFSYDRNRIVR
jgi:tetratricopeptide (TPR) repeat protein